MFLGGYKSRRTDRGTMAFRNLSFLGFVVRKFVASERSGIRGIGTLSLSKIRGIRTFGNSWYQNAVFVGVDVVSKIRNIIAIPWDRSNQGCYCQTSIVDVYL